MVTTAKSRRDSQVSTSLRLVDEGMELLQGARDYWTSIEDITPAGDEFMPLYRHLSDHATRFRSHVMEHEDDLGHEILQDLEIASTELDGLLAAYFHGYGYHDPAWRREAEHRIRQLNKYQSRIHRWLAGERRNVSTDDKNETVGLGGMARMMEDRQIALNRLQAVARGIEERMSVEQWPSSTMLIREDRDSRGSAA